MKFLLLFLFVTVFNAYVIARHPRRERHHGSVLTVGHKRNDDGAFLKHDRDGLHAPQSMHHSKHRQKQKQKYGNIDESKPRHTFNSKAANVEHKKSHLEIETKHRSQKQPSIQHNNKHHFPDLHLGKHGSHGTKSYHFHKSHDIPVYDDGKVGRINGRQNHSRKHSKLSKKNKTNGNRKTFANTNEFPVDHPFRKDKTNSKNLNNNFEDRRKNHLKHLEIHGHQEKHLKVHMHTAGHEKSRKDKHAYKRINAKSSRSHSDLKSESKMLRKKKTQRNPIPSERKWYRKRDRDMVNHQGFQKHAVGHSRINKQKFWCLKKRTCPLRLKPVCGSNGRTYTNRCQLRKVACINGGYKSITIQHRGACKLQLGHVV